MAGRGGPAALMRGAVPPRLAGGGKLAAAIVAMRPESLRSIGAGTAATGASAASAASSRKVTAGITGPVLGRGIPGSGGRASTGRVPARASTGNVPARARREAWSCRARP